MTYEQAKARIPKRDLPAFWAGSPESVITGIEKVKRGQVTEITRSPGGRSLFLVAYGKPDPVSPRANYGSAVGAWNREAYFDKAAREKPIVLFVGPVHGQETEGLTGLMNLIAVMETGRDIAGRDRQGLKALGDRCRLLIIPSGNPDGLARFEPRSLKDMEFDDLRFWGQGTWKDDTLCGCPECYVPHPITDAEIGFLGAYFNDEGINPMEDELFAPMGPESQAILRVAQRWGPDLAVSLHSHDGAPKTHRPPYVPRTAQDAVWALSNRLYDKLRERNLPVEEIDWKTCLDEGTVEDRQSLDIVSALYHISGAASFVFECPHGLREKCPVSFEQILEIQFELYEAMLEFVLRR